MSAIDRIVGGLEKRNMPMSASERRATAIHEAGHALVMWSLPECDPVLKVTVVPRGKALGATWSVPDEERVHVTDEALEEQLSGLLGGRIAEEVNYGTLGAGSLSDLERATKTAYAMVAYYGMSKKIGPISYYDSTGTRDTFTKPFSEETARDIDDEVRRMLEEAYNRARAIIEAKNDKLNAMADLLMEKETIYAEDLERLLGPSAQSLNRKEEEKKEQKLEEKEKKEGENEGAGTVRSAQVEDSEFAPASTAPNEATSDGGPAAKRDETTADGANDDVRPADASTANGKSDGDAESSGDESKQ